MVISDEVELVKPSKNEERTEIINNMDEKIWNVLLLLECTAMFNILGNEYVLTTDEAGSG